MRSDPDLRLGFIGIGTMGAPMVQCLAKAGYRPTLLDANRDAARAVAAKAELDIAASAPELGRSSNLVILMLPRSDIVRQVCLGTAEGGSGLAAGLPKGSTIIDMSSSDPMETRRLGAELAQFGIALLDAPVSGGVRKAVAGTLAIMLGGDDEALMSRVTPVLEAMGSIHRTGGLASGHAAKALNNYVSAAGLAAACEAVIVGRRFGLDPHTLVRVINASTGRNNATENKLEQFVLNGDLGKAGFMLDLMAKDVALAAALSDGLDLHLPGLAEARRLWSEASRHLQHGADHTEIFRYLEAAADDGAA
ncbi:NAD(P)-dependent oxidoreductase [Pseudohoeflea coraliihabitans]|uniref:NAD(P)-dependent oxidoreductase n=1 Tax=Pseudohoeflea coraliihabitans TaxID=2860393 RepID=A0ABS6WKE7_9HYPH|nr:NAD(P)-dependent oxidoreductase [Pseudohoeflea sp. DP4N28-3]MBW3096427.1 NAD(P)-dependent oxidoreductase [Pseudohoeflea sp. DP4N28-3]